MHLPFVRPNAERVTSARTESAMIASGYFWLYAGVGAFVPYTALYYQHLGFGGVGLGVLMALPAIAAALTGPFWGAFADATAAHRLILRIVPLIAAVMTLLLSRITEFVPFLLALGVMSFAMVPVASLWDSYAVSAGERGGASFGSLRIFGSIGFTVMVLFTGELMANGMSRRFLYAYAIAHVLTSASTLLLPRLAERRPRRLMDGLGEIVRRRPYLLLLVVAYLIASGVAMINNFLGIHIKGLGGGTDIVGLAFAISAVSELPIIGFGTWIMKRIGARRMVYIALVAYIVRFTVLTSAPSAEWVLVAQVFHGVSFGMFLVASISLAHRLGGKENAATAQALLATMSFGFGNITGSLLGGVLLDLIGTTWMYVGVVGVMIIALAIWTVGNLRLGRDAYEPEPA